MDHSDWKAKLQATCHRLWGADAHLANLQRLSGGANMESWRFDAGTLPCVLRRAPSEAFMAERPFSLAVEAELVRAACAAGVRAPQVLGVLQAADGLGQGYVMRRIEAEVEPARILAAPPPLALASVARELALIHRIKPSAALPLPVQDTAAALAGLKARFMAYGGNRPVLALALRWCEQHLPEPVPPCLVHGDYRMGNLMFDAQGIAGVLDWELAHWGDAHEDLAYGCMTAWRFGRIEQAAFGLGSLDEWVAAYEAASGTTVQRERLLYWLVHRTLWWALGCLQMAQSWRSGADRSLERVVVGRRVSENELDLLLLLEEDAPTTERQPLPAAPQQALAHQGEPHAAEVLQALREWVEQAVKPHTQGRERFMAAVAINALGQLQREALNPVPLHDAELAARLLSGQDTLATAGMLSHLRKTCLAKLANDGPKYAALTLARQLWTESAK